MAKKVRKPPEDEAATFEFPTFDEAKFLAKEFELGGGLVLAAVLAAVVGVVCWAITSLAGIVWYVPFLLGIAFVITSPYLLGRLRERSHLYTRGDWAGLIALEFFGWLALWFVLVNVT